jgi:hypothetical protein
MPVTFRRQRHVMRLDITAGDFVFAAGRRRIGRIPKDAPVASQWRPTRALPSSVSLDHQTRRLFDDFHHRVATGLSAPGWGGSSVSTPANARFELVRSARSRPPIARLIGSSSGILAGRFVM